MAALNKREGEAQEVIQKGGWCHLNVTFQKGYF